MNEQLESLIHANINNLTSLWKAAGMPFQSYFERGIFNYCQIQNSDWPNRLWFNQDLSQAAVEMAFERIVTSPTRLIVPYWDIYGSKSYQYLEAKGFSQLFGQVGMSLKLDQPFAQQNILDIKRVSDESEVKVWADIYPQAFGYRISQEILANSYKDIHYYMAYYQYQPIGTAILFKTDTTAGIHGVGVVPEMRRKGLADELMKFVLNQAIDSHAEYATLQASEMGKGLYLKLGFEEQFILKNYVLPQNL